MGVLRLELIRHRVICSRIPACLRKKDVVAQRKCFEREQVVL
jgi:hypothetical protein